MMEGMEGYVYLMEEEVKYVLDLHGVHSICKVCADRTILYCILQLV